MKSYTGKWVFITGGSTGIGLAAAKLFASLGANIILFARDPAKLASAQTEISSNKAKEGQVIIFYAADISDATSIPILQKAVSENAAPDILLNCVGRAYPDYFENLSPQHFDETMRSNMYSVWNACAALIPAMKLNGGHIVNTASMAGILGVFGYTDYCASKFAVVGFSGALESELRRHNIRVSVLCPPDTDTPGFEAENINKPEETKAISGNARLLKPEYVAQTLIKGIEKKRFMIIPGFEGRFTYLLVRLFPRLVFYIMQRSVRSVQKKQHAK